MKYFNAFRTGKKLYVFHFSEKLRVIINYTKIHKNLFFLKIGSLRAFWFFAKNLYGGVSLLEGYCRF